MERNNKKKTTKETNKCFTLYLVKIAINNCIYPAYYYYNMIDTYIIYFAIYFTDLLYI